MKKSLFIIILFLLFLILYSWISYSSCNSDNYYLIFKYFFYLIFFFGIPGFFLSSNIPIRSIEERISVSLITGIISVSTVTFAYCAYFSEKVVIGKIIIFSLLLFFIGLSNTKTSAFEEIKCSFQKFHRKDISKVLLLLILIILIWNIYNITYDPNAVFIPSIDRWSKIDSTSCWVYCTLLITDYAKDLKTYKYNEIKSIFDFPPWITFGNVAFSSVFLELFQMSSWRFLYLMQGIFIGIFLYFIFLKIHTGVYVSFFSALVCSCNPFFLNMTTPDRNVIAVMLCIFLYYLFLTAKRNYILAGFATGVLISVGLRHIPIFPAIVFLYLFIIYKNEDEKISFKNILLYLIFITFPLLTSISHLKSGIQGAPFIEKHSFIGLFSFNYRGLLNFPFSDKMMRDPYYVFPPFFNNIMMFFRQCGYLFSSICLLGSYYMFRKEKKIFFAVSFVLIVISIILGIQSDWLHYNKLYPFATVFFPLFIYFMYGIRYLYKNIKNGIVGIILSVIIVALFVRYISNMNFPVDKRIYKHYELNIETREEYNDSKKELCSVPFFPDISHLYSFYEIKKDFFYELKYNNIKDFLKNRKYLMNNDIIHIAVEHYENNLKNEKNNDEKLVSFNIGRPVFYSDIKDLFKVMKTYAKTNCFFINKNEDSDLNIPDAYNSKWLIKRYDKDHNAFFYFYKLRNMKLKNTENIDKVSLNSGFFKNDETDINLGFTIFKNNYFSIFKETAFKYKEGKLTGLFNIKSDIWTFKVRDKDIKLISYYNNYTYKKF